jgi:hypothetical protein
MGVAAHQADSATRHLLVPLFVMVTVRRATLGLSKGVAVADVVYDGVTGAGGGQIASRGTGDIPAMPGEPGSVTIATWPPAGWGPKRYIIDVSGQRVGVVAPSGG